MFGLLRILAVLAVFLSWLNALENSRSDESSDLVKINSFVADFKQVATQENEKIVYFGKIYAKTPGFARWVYTSPLQKEVYINQNKVIVYEPRLFQATYYSSNKNLDILSILRLAKETDNEYVSPSKEEQEPSTFSKNNSKNETFETITQNESGELVLVEVQDLGESKDQDDENIGSEKDLLIKEGLSAIKEQKNTKTYHIEFDGVNYELITENAKPSIIKFTDEFGNLIQIKLSNVSINVNLKDAIFRFNPPSGIDLIRQ